MNSSPLRLKNTRNWFAAGLEVQQAMNTLSDGAFKLFMYICLNARRDSGILCTTQTELAQNLKKSHGTIRKHLREMETTGICSQNYFTNSPVGQGTIQISSSYWPYETGATEPTPTDAEDVFVCNVRKALAERACVRPSFSTADEVLARHWFGRGVSIERIRQVILLGCSRKYVSWRNNQAHGPISSLAYFEPILDEVEHEKIDPDYWGYLQLRIHRHEKLWIESHDKKAMSETGTNAQHDGGAIAELQGAADQLLKSQPA
jgi:hypothetical protein